MPPWTAPQRAVVLAHGYLALKRGHEAQRARPTKPPRNRRRDARTIAEEHGDGTLELRGRKDQLGARGDAARVDALLGRAGTRVTMTFVFTDIVDSTRHLEHLGDANWQKLLRRHDELIGRIAAAEGGTVVDHTCNGFFLAFRAARRLAAAALQSSARRAATCRSSCASASIPPKRRASATTTAARASTLRRASALSRAARRSSRAGRPSRASAACARASREASS